MMMPRISKNCRKPRARNPAERGIPSGVPFNLQNQTFKIKKRPHFIWRSLVFFLRLFAALSAFNPLIDIGYLTSTHITLTLHYD